MPKTRKIHKAQMLGVTTFIVAANLLSLSAFTAPAPSPVNLSWPPRPDFSVLAKGVDADSLAQYHRNEWGAPAADQNGLDIYYQSERMLPAN